MIYRATGRLLDGGYRPLEASAVHHHPIFLAVGALRRGDQGGADE